MVINVQGTFSGHYHWPDVVIDPYQESIAHPKRFPLKASTQNRPQLPGN
jgi:hypothetical protein